MNEDKPQRDARMCAADGCPMRWSVDMGNGLLCSWHNRAKLHEWPAVTQELQRMVRDGTHPLYPQPERAPRLKHPGGRETGLDPLHWARSLQFREEAGEHLTPFQRDRWRTALRHELAAEQASE